uniref:OSJNBa0011E07.4 protein n=1 Tax=Oryza sativa subsp. japonica TaxID=39947 RepID=Q7XX56_ORYSJ|nr:OSJNBb0049I21.10 [Oryza sativa Japonica Group]CAE04195.2 OSJNBa0011E07.4 [Oryza sativa Japonica Group]
MRRISPATEEGGAPADFRRRGAAAEVLLVLAELREATARVGVDRSGGATRLESAATAERGGSRGYGATEVERGNGADARVRHDVVKPLVAVVRNDGGGSGCGDRLEGRRRAAVGGATVAGWFSCTGGLGREGKREREIENSDPVFVAPEEQPDKISSWTAKPTLTPALRSFVKAIDDLRVRGLSGYEVAADFVGRRIQPLQARAHPAFDYSGPEDTTRVSPQGLNSETVEWHVDQLMISGLTMADDVPVPLCEKEATEREAAINALPLTDVIGQLVDHQAAASWKEGVIQEASDAAATAVTSGSRPPRRGRKFTSVLGGRGQRRRRIGLVRHPARLLQLPPLTSWSPHEVGTPHGLSGDLGLVRGPPADVLSWGELQVEMGRLLEAGAHGISREIAEARIAAASSANERANKLERELAELAGESGVTTTILVNPDEFSLASSLAVLATAIEGIHSKHAARIGEETSNGIYTGACHVLACDRLAHPELDLQRVLEQGATNDARRGVMEEVGDLGESVLPLFEEDVDVEDVQQRGQPESSPILPDLASEGHAWLDNMDEILSARTGTTTTSLDLENALADQDRRIQYWKTKFEVAELERAMLEVKKKQAVETLRGRESSIPK